MAKNVCPPVPRPRQCWQQNQQKNLTGPTQVNFKSDWSATNKPSVAKTIQLSEDDMYKFLGKEFCLPRSPASSKQEKVPEKVPVVVQTTPSITTPAVVAPPKPPRQLKRMLSNPNNNQDFSSKTVQTASKPPMPLPRTMFLAIKTPPRLPSRPPVANRALN